MTGMSGAGKTKAIQTFEDLGYFCVDNLPTALLHKFIDLLQTSTEINKVAVVIDLRSPGTNQEFVNSLRSLARNQHEQENVIFLDAATNVLVSRYEESRRNHPLARNGRIVDGIEKERSEMAAVKADANLVIDTTDLTSNQLREKIIASFEQHGFDPFHVELMSFGFKYGLPLDADMLFDVRFLSNPYYLPELRNQTGRDAPVYQYVMNQPTAEGFFTRLAALLDFQLPQIKNSSKASETIAIGCTGGQHRSVAMTERLAQNLQQAGYTVNVTHRDIDRHEGIGK
ncbi:RNase adapter RapZ [Fructilactobacillus florum]|uniref:RNase adapter RapZ n=1 Tax=Fructilactobacillus florum TaxID=640331 RepID=UPI0025B0DFEB|nr:RNase adapter RapZ [Fructilactobacillus florum]